MLKETLSLSSDSAWLPGALGALFLIWCISLVLRRASLISRETMQFLLLACLAFIYESIRRWAPIPEHLNPWLKTLELVLLTFLTIHVVVKLYIGRFLERRRSLPMARILRDLTTVLIIAVFGMVFLRMVLNVNLTAILTPSAILTAIVGLSLQDTIGNFIAGLIIQIEKPFDHNDWIEVDGQRGQVRELNWRYTKIETTDKIYLIIPNARLSAEKLINYSKPTPVVREFLTIGVSYDVPPVKIKQAVMAVLKSNSRIINKDACEVLLHQYGDSSIIYRIGYMIGDPGEYRYVRDEVHSAIWYQFRKHAIEIPFPIRTVIMKQPAPENDHEAPAQLLGALSLFEGVQADSLNALARFGLTHATAPGQTIVLEQTPGETMFFILDGEFNVLQNRQQKTTLRKGDFFGEMSLLTGARRNADVVAASHGKLLEIDRGAFKILIETEPLVIQHIEKIFAERCQTNNTATDSAAAENKSNLFQRFRKRFGLA